MSLYSYVVRYDSGFAPNPFYSYCSLATCKPRIRKNAAIGDWVIGLGSASKMVSQGGRVVYVMRVTETLSFDDYFHDIRFKFKKPNLRGSRKQARGDNIYSKKDNDWTQLNSFHSNKDGSSNSQHTEKDTKTNRVLISENYTYFGTNGPFLPENLISRGKPLIHKGISESKFLDSNLEDRIMIEEFIDWYNSLHLKGFIGHPFDWQDLPIGSP